MNKLLIFLVAVLIGWFFLFNDEVSKMKPPAARQQQTPSPMPKPDKISPNNGANWPFSSDSEETTVLDSDQTRKNYLLIFDGSGSMGETRCSGARTKAAVAKDAVSNWASSVPEDANLGLIVFDQKGLSVRLPLGINNRDQFRHKISEVVPSYKTPLTLAIDHAYEILTIQARTQLGYGEYSIVVVTDGVANDPAALGRSVSRILSESPVMINTIGFCIASSHALNQPGKTIYKAADDPAALSQGLQAIMAESEAFDISAFK